MEHRFSNIAVIFTLLFSGAFAAAHGEDKPGPNGGYIRMPGAYHTEVVVTEPHRLKVFLLDINWKNPTVEDSGVSVTIASAKPASTDCIAAKDHFVCELPKNINLKSSGTLSLISTRAKKKGAVATYALPLSFGPPAAESTKDKHHNHH